MMLFLLACADDTACPPNQIYDETSKRCEVIEDSGGAEDSGTGNSGTDSGTGDSGAGDSDPVTDSTGDSAPPSGATLVFIPEDPAVLSTATLGIFAVDSYFESVPDPSAIYAATTMAEDVFTVAWTPAASELYEDPIAPGNQVAKFTTALFIDADSSGSWESGEELVGMPVYQLYYVADAPTGYLAELGLVQGWNAIDLHTTDLYDVPETCDPLAIPTRDNLRETASVTMGGTSERVIASDERFATQYTTYGDAVLVDGGAATDPWSLTFSGTPDPSVQMEMVPGINYTTGYPYVYADANGNQTPDRTEPYALLPFTTEGQEAMVSWFNQPTDLDYAHRLLVRLGVTQFGWGVAWVGEGGFSFIDETTASTLTLIAVH